MPVVSTPQDCFYVIVTGKGRSHGVQYAYRAPHLAVQLVEDLSLSTKFQKADAQTVATALGGTVITVTHPCF